MVGLVYKLGLCVGLWNKWMLCVWRVLRVCLYNVQCRNLCCVQCVMFQLCGEGSIYNLIISVVLVFAMSGVCKV